MRISIFAGAVFFGGSEGVGLAKNDGVKLKGLLILFRLCQPSVSCAYENGDN
jgi:hypothetical protein